jgi:hypothetical protein
LFSKTKENNKKKMKARLSIPVFFIIFFCFRKQKKEPNRQSEASPIWRF